jgi:hypothetical protein
MQIINFFKTKPQYFGFIISIFGVLMLLGAIFNANFIFGDGSGPKSFNLTKIIGIVSMFGRLPARIIVGIMGIFMIIFGIFWFLAYQK